MDASESRDSDQPQNPTADEHSPRSDVASRRRELARLIGRLLAKRWLRQQQREDRRSPAGARSGHVPYST